jgi:hypothetical protein
MFLRNVVCVICHMTVLFWARNVYASMQWSRDYTQSSVHTDARLCVPRMMSRLARLCKPERSKRGRATPGVGAPRSMGDASWEGSSGGLRGWQLPLLRVLEL